MKGRYPGHRTNGAVRIEAAQQVVAVDGAGRPEVFHYLPVRRSDVAACLASGHAATELCFEHY
jgi:hypothetical protein